MKSKILAVFCLVSVLLLTVLCYEASAVKGGILRFHVIANSDSPEDQKAKMLVRDAVLDCGRDVLFDCKNSNQAVEMLKKSGPEILAAAEGVLEKEGIEYGAQLELGTYEFPRREYRGVVYPEGTYRALRVVLGKGLGQNWWCVMFPPLCIIDTGGLEQSEVWKEYERTGTVEFESAIVKLVEYLKSSRGGEAKSILVKLAEFFKGA
ncbi:MAG: Stage II sporulation protein R (spore_II_R) [Firmicutes bacterium ADurb.Bin182]|nr:MAG: Stage II sporulation protein R (spore_II_R) [Firmicutes bacterium ADurb.Bin182]